MRADFSEWFQAEARCALHPQHDATLTCARCGVFCCEGCSTARWCDPCVPVAIGELLPELAKGVSWKLVVTPVVMVIAAVGLWRTGHELPWSVALWAVPVGCAGVVLRRSSAVAAWAGALGTLGLVWGAATQSAPLDLALLSVAPVLSLEGAYRLSRARRYVHC